MSGRSPGPPLPEAASQATAAAAPDARRGRLAVAGLALGVGLAAGFWLGRRVRRVPRAAPGHGGREARRDADDALHRALAAGDAATAAAAASRALRLALEHALPGARTLAVEELAAAAPGGLAAAVALLARLERARFAGSDPATLLALAREAEPLAR